MKEILCGIGIIIVIILLCTNSNSNKIHQESGIEYKIVTLESNKFIMYKPPVGYILVPVK
jgi:hypothetical protein